MQDDAPTDANPPRESSASGGQGAALPASLELPTAKLLEAMAEGCVYGRLIFDGDNPIDTEYRYVNPAFERLTGLRGVVGKRRSELFMGAEDTDTEMLELFARVARTGTPETTETYVRALGKWYSISVVCPEPEHYVSIFTDITARRQANERLRDREAALVESLRIAGQGSFELDLANGTWTSSEIEDGLLGIDEAYDRSIVGWIALVHPDDRARVADAPARDESGPGQVFEQEYRIIRQTDQAVRWMRSRAILKRDSDGRSTRLRGTHVDISDSKNVQAALAESEFFFRESQQAGRVGSYRADLRAGTVKSSPMYDEIYGIDASYERSALEGLATLIHPEDQEMVRRYFQEDVLGRRQRFDKEYRIVRRSDGGVRWVRTTGTLEFDGDGAVVALSGTSHDISERREAVDQLAGTLAWLEQTGAMAKVGAWEVDLRTNKHKWSTETYRIHELDPSVEPDLVSGISFYAPEAQPVILAAVQAAIDHGTPYDLEVPFITAKGRSIWVRTQGAAEMEDGKAVRLVGAFHDITDRIEAQRSLRENEERLRLAIEATGLGIFDWNMLTGNIVVSARFMEILGYEPAEFEGADAALIGLVHPDDREQVDRYVRESLAGVRSEYRQEFRQRSKAGEWVWVLSTGCVVEHDAAGRPVRMLGTQSDISALKAAELQVAELNDELRHHAQSLEVRVAHRTTELKAANAALEAFASAVSHDLRAPLRAIAGFGAALQSSYRDRLDDQGRHYLARMEAATQLMGHLIDDLLNLSRIQRSELHRETVDVGSVAREIAGELQARDPQREARFAIAEACVANADARLLRIALRNLLDNAWKFTGTQPVARIEFGATDESSSSPVTFFVRDNGVGFDMAYVGKLFTPFQRLHSTAEFPGTGIGLATVQRIVARHGGRVWAEGAIGQGTTVYFTLGNHTGADAAPAAPGGAAP